MSDIKMSDVFELPMVVDGNDVESQPYQHPGMSYEMKSDITCDSGDDARYVAHAINSHDALVEQLAAAKAEIADLKADVKFMCDMYPYHGFTTSQYDKMVLILAKHKVTKDEG